MVQTDSRKLQASTITVNEKYLQLVPRKNAEQLWKTDSSGLVEIIVRRDRLLDNVMRRFRKTPEAMRVHLDPEGSFIWKAIDGRRSILYIGTLLEAEFGEKANPLYSRLLRFICILKNNRFITLEKT